MSKPLPNGPYDATKEEPEILKFWLENSYFKPEYNGQKLLTTEEMKKDSRDPYAIINPPPNAYMRPHIGNVSGYAYQDVFLRYNRLLGKKVLGQPGKDHAGIQGEVVVEKIFMENKKKTKLDMGREKFYRAAYEHFQKLMPMIMQDEQRIGLSSDYDRNLFTLDPRVVNTVLGTFTKMFNEGMIYKGVRIVNWDPVAKTTLADIDTERLDRDTELVYLKYPLIKQRAWYLSFYDQEILARVKDGSKKIETRALNPEEPDRFFGDMKPGDLIVCVDKSGSEFFWYYKKVAGFSIYKNISEVFAKLDHEKAFGHKFSSETELRKRYDQFSEGYAKKIDENGLIAFDLEDLSDDDFIVVATTRAETMLGDTAVIVNPKDKGYKNLVGSRVILPLANREIPVITSPRVEKEFGTGAVKLTPAHAYDDYVMMNEWNYDHAKQAVGYINIIDKEGRLTGPVPAKYKGLPTADCRKIIIEDLQLLGLVQKIEAHNQSVMIGERSKAVVEQIMSSQWFIDVEKLKKPAIEVVKNGKVKIHPEYMKKKYLNWMENLHDWPVSRSLWWGYRIPVWYKGEITESVDEAGQIANTIGGEPISDMAEAVKKGLAKVQQLPPGTELTVVRHGETQLNQERIFIGRTDPELNNTGRDQAKTFSRSLKGKYDLIISSPLKRTLQTAEIIGREHKVKVISDDNLQERFWGELEGISYEEFEQKYPELAKKNTRDYQPDLPKGESIPDMEARVQKFVETVEQKYAGQKILVVTHAGVIRILKRLLLKETAAESRTNDPEFLSSYEMSIAEPGWIQDSDVLDTWFSSGQWPYATLGADNLMDTFYPTAVMETSYDILELWVSRMIMLGLYTQKEIPFRHVYLHGLVKGPDGQKMSKSKNNVVQPEAIITKFGADSLRLLYLIGNKAGAGYPVSYEKLEGYKRFLNKIWNASKFVISNLEDTGSKLNDLKDSDLKFSKEDDEMRKHLNSIVKESTKRIDTYNLGFASQELYESFWHYFADIYLEQVKPRLYTKDREGNPINTSEAEQESRLAAQWTIYNTLKIYLKLLHPFIPFITERVWQAMPKADGESETIMYAKWPSA